METYELEEQIHSAFLTNERLIELLAKGKDSIFHYVAPATYQYPAIVYAPISDVPALAGDNRELFHRVTIRIHVITAAQNTFADQQKFLEVCKLVKEIMTGLRFIRHQSTPMVLDGKAMLIHDFIKGVRS